MPKRKFDDINDVQPQMNVAGVSFKNSLDSDEDDDEVEDEAYNVMNDDEFEGKILIYYLEIEKIFYFVFRI